MKFASLSNGTVKNVVLGGDGCSDGFADTRTKTSISRDSDIKGVVAEQQPHKGFSILDSQHRSTFKSG